MQSNTSETFEFIQVERKEKSNLFNRSYFNSVHSVVKPKSVQVVHPQPRRLSPKATVKKPEANSPVPEVLTDVSDVARDSVNHDPVSSGTAPTVSSHNEVNGCLEMT